MAGHEHTCAFKESYDPKTFEPLGPACGKPAMQELYWHDGRVSPSCSEHGMRALAEDGRALVMRVTYPTCEDEWATTGCIRLCAACQPKAEPYVKPMEEMTRKFEAAMHDGVAFDERFLREAEKLARSFDAILCAECRKLGPRLPGPDEWPFDQGNG